MRRILSADKDVFITDKIIDSTRVTDANTGHAASLALFYLHNESSLSGTTGSIDEISRILIHFNLNPLRALTGTIFNLNSFNSKLKLFDVYGGQTTPSNFTVSVHALSKSFDEGNGRDLYSFRDLDSANFITSSVLNGSSTLWTLSGANHPTQDYISSTVQYQTFSSGEEDLEIDITNIISSTLAGGLPDYGMRISFSGTHETDGRTKFVKRFGSRQANNPLIRPQLVVSFDDSIQDDSSNFFFDLTGSLFLYNTNYGQLTNIPGVTGSNSFILELVSGTNTNIVLSGTHILSQSISGTNTHRFLSGTYINLSGNLYRRFITGSQLSISGNFITGAYVATFAISPNETGSLLTEVRAANSATFTTIWRNFAGDVAYQTGSLVISQVPRINSFKPDVNVLRIINNAGSYKSDEKVMFRIFAQKSLPQILVSKKTPFIRKSEIIKNMWYQIVDANSKKVIIPFDTTYTKVSVDSEGMYFNLYMEDLHPGLSYGIELRFNDQGTTVTYDYNKLGSVFTIK